MNIGEPLRAAVDGEMSWDDFFRLTREHWAGVARKIYRKWQTPADVDERDVEQELVAEAWRAAVKWSPTGGVRLAPYVTVSAKRRAERWIHERRNALSRSGKSPGRFPRPASDLIEPSHRDDGRGHHRRLLSQIATHSVASPDQETRVDAIRVAEIARANAVGSRQRECATALVEARGDPDRAAMILIRDPPRRRRARITTSDFHALGREIVKQTKLAAGAMR